MPSWEENYFCYKLSKFTQDHFEYLIIFFHSQDLTRTSFPGMYWDLSWECLSLKAVSSNLLSRDGLTVLARIKYTISHPTSYNTSHTQWKPSDPLLLADVTFRCRMYPAGKVEISWHLTTPGFPQSDHNASKPRMHSRPPDLKSSSNVSLPLAWITGPATDPRYYFE